MILELIHSLCLFAVLLVAILFATDGLNKLKSRKYLASKGRSQQQESPQPREDIVERKVPRKYQELSYKLIFASACIVAVLSTYLRNVCKRI